ncbi:hypothetical protein JZ751_002720 [Albula glossodonta]|uniref:Uncharacterized protein n=1 Tax=Albula glossodonta TaxID=121402 RepID=A0A8T2N7Q8_9TELE|nr:hypothetical protein JZ751_002720 [Albula glossodonta]
MAAPGERERAKNGASEERDQPLPSTSRDRSSPRTMLVMLPSTRQDRVSASISTVETDSSENDVF